METLFSQIDTVKTLKNAPLAVRMRPTSLDDYVGQKRLWARVRGLRSAIEHDVLSSVILYGPAGTGKTRLLTSSPRTRAASLLRSQRLPVR